MTEDIFRVVTVVDAPEFLELLSSAFQSLKVSGIDWLSTNADLAMVTEYIVNSSAFVLERNGKLISTITVRFPCESSSPPSKYPCVWWLATAPELAGQGIGDQLSV
ncbi:acetyltransferase, partial [Listeria monocytogenes]